MAHLEAISTSCVVLGSFNIYIVQPHWLEKQSLVDDPKATVKVDFARAGWRIESNDSSLQWVVRPDGVSITADGDSELPFEKMKVLLERLPQTPLVAMGFNFEHGFTPTPGSDFAFVHPIKREERMPIDLVVERRAWHIELGYFGKTFNIQASELEDRVEVSVNVHTDLPKSATWQEAKEAFEHLPQLRQTTQELLREFFPVEKGSK